MARRTKTDEQRIRLLIKDIPKEHHEQAKQLAQNAIAIEDKLDETRNKIWGMDVVVPYNNGGGQKGLRENPAYKAYSNLLSSYHKVLCQLDGMRVSDKGNSSFFDWNK